MTTRPEPVTLAELISRCRSRWSRALAYIELPRPAWTRRTSKKLARLEVANVNVRMRRLLDMLTKRQNAARN